MPIADPPALVIARCARQVGDVGWFDAKSWFGGAPKLGDMPWPRDSKGKPLYFMAQLDLSEIAAASHGRSALPTEGSFAFFVGGAKAGAIVHVRRPGSNPTALPADLCKAEEIGGDPFVDRSHRFGTSQFPHWPVEFRSLDSPTQVDRTDEEALDRAYLDQTAAVARHYQRREYYLSLAAERGELPLYWLAARIFAERVPRMRDRVEEAKARGRRYVETSTERLRALEAGLPPPPGQGGFGEPAAERANSESWLATGTKAIADAEHNAAAVEAYIAKVGAAVMADDPWALISERDAKRLDDLFDEARSPPLEDYARYILPLRWRDYAVDAIKLMASGSDDAFARLPDSLRDLLNSRYRLPAECEHLMFGIGLDIQGNEMFEHPDMRMVQQLTFDDMMYWPFGDNGVYQFWMPTNALQAGDVAKAVVTFECH